MSRSKSFTFAIAIVAMLLLSASVLSQEAKLPSTADEVVRSGMTALGQLDIETYTSLMHPSDMETFQQMLWPILEGRIADDSSGQEGTLAQMFGVEVIDGKPQPVDAREFFAKFMNFMVNVSPDLKRAMTDVEYVVIGGVPEGDTLMHYVVRAYITLNETSGSSTDIVTLRKAGDNWRLALSGELKEIAGTIRQQLTGNSGR